MEVFYSSNKLKQISKLNPSWSIKWRVLVSLWFCSFSRLVASTFGDFTYEIHHGIYVEITDYPSNAVGDIEIPDFIAGRFVGVIGGGAFSDCSGLTSINFPDSLNIIYGNAFSNCSGLTSINLPDSLHTLGSNAFADCTGLVSITLGESYKVNGNYAFTGCSSLTNFFVNESHQSYSSVNGVLFDKTETILKLIPPGKTPYVIPDSVTSIGDYAFAGSKTLTQITIPDTVTSIGNLAFADCTALTQITIPDTVTSIGYSAFSGCTSLTQVTIPDSVTSLEDSAFANCTALTQITIPDSVTSIGYSAFEGCTSLTQVIIPDSVTSIGDYAFIDCYGTSFVIHFDFYDDVMSGRIGIDPYDYTSSGVIPVQYVYDEKTDALFYSIHNGEVAITGCTPDVSGEMIIPSEIEGYPVTQIVHFEGSRLTSIVVPEGVSRFGHYAFVECRALESISLPDSLTWWEDGVFTGCSSLKEIVIPAGVSNIPMRAFSNCHALSSITIPENIISIDTGFYGCTSLKFLYIPSNVMSMRSIGYGFEPTYIKAPFQAFGGLPVRDIITMDSTVLEIYYPDIKDVLTYEIENGEVTITDCDNDAALRLEIPESIDGLQITAIGPYAFEGCHYLTEVVIPETVGIIGKYAFSDCRTLERVNIPDGVTRIEEFTFTDLERITIPASVTHIAWRGISSQIVIFEGDAPVVEGHYPGTFESSMTYYFEGAEGFSSLDYQDTTELPTLNIDSDEDGWPDAYEVMLMQYSDDPLSASFRTNFSRNGDFWNIRLEPEVDNLAGDLSVCNYTLERSSSLGTGANWEPIYGWAFGNEYGDYRWSIVRVPINDDDLTFYRLRVSHK